MPNRNLKSTEINRWRPKVANMLFFGVIPSIFAYRIQRFCDKETYILFQTDFFLEQVFWTRYKNCREYLRETATVIPNTLQGCEDRMN